MKYPKTIISFLIFSLLIVPLPGFGKQFVLKCFEEKFNGKPITGKNPIPFLIKFDTIEKTFQYQEEKSFDNRIISGEATFYPSYIAFIKIKKGGVVLPDLEVRYIIDRTDLTYAMVQKSDNSYSTRTGTCKLTPEFRRKINLI